jgi:hemerythrin
MALGNTEGIIELFVNETDLYSSSMFRHGASRFERPDPVLNALQVPVRRLDTLVDEGTIPPPDFLKIDVEGFERDVLLGSSRHLGGLRGFEVESSFGISGIYPDTHFGLMMSVALANHLLVFDIEFNRVPTTTFQEALSLNQLDPVLDHFSIGKPATLNVLFGLDLIQEADHPEVYKTSPRVPSVDCLIKQMVVFELYGLNDIAVDLSRRFAIMLGERLDVDKAVHLLADPHCRVPGGRSAVLAKREFETEQQLALNRRLLELADAREAERLASKRRIEELQAELAAYRGAHAATVDRLQAELAAYRGAHAATVARMTKQWTAERQASDRRIEELQAELVEYRGAHTAAMDRIIKHTEEVTATKGKAKDFLRRISKKVLET